MVHRHEHSSSEGALVRVLDGDGLVSLFVVVGYLEAHVDDFDNRLVSIEGYRGLHLVVDGFKQDTQEFHGGQRPAECVVSLANDTVLFVCGLVLRDNGGSVGVGE